VEYVDSAAIAVEQAASGRNNGSPKRTLDGTITINAEHTGRKSRTIPSSPSLESATVRLMSDMFAWCRLSLVALTIAMVNWLSKRFVSLRSLRCILNPKRDNYEPKPFRFP
jgi:hypothetical protein